MAIKLRLNKPQFAAFAACEPGNTIVTPWGRGVGKSWFHRQIWWLNVAAHEWRLRENAPKLLRGVRIVVLMPTLKQYKDVHASGIAGELLDPDGDFYFLGGKYDRSTGEVRFPGGSVVKPMPASVYNSRTARGLRADILDLDEADDIDLDVYAGVALPWLSEPWSLRMTLIGGTPTRGRNGLWWRFVEAGRQGALLREGADPDLLGVEADTVDALKRIYSFRATYLDSPETVSMQAVEAARATSSAATFRREWCADPDAGEGLVYEFDPALHVRPAPPIDSFGSLIVGADFGDVDPGVLLLIGLHGHGGDVTAHVIAEHYESSCLNSTWDQRAVAWRGAVFYPDPSRKDRIRDWRALGIQVQDLPADVKPILVGVGRVCEMLARRPSEHGADWSRFSIDPSCRNTIREFGLYARKKHPDGTPSESPADSNNHAMDALRYAIAGSLGGASGHKKILTHK